MSATKAYSVTNTSDGPKVLNAVPVTVLQAGQTIDSAEMSEAEFASAQASGWFGFDAKLPALRGNKAQLLEIAAAEEVTEALDKDGNTIPIADATNEQIIAAIEAKRAA